MIEATDCWYTRAQGRTLGPFTLNQILSLRDRGKLSQFHEVSHDRCSWRSAAQVSEIFSGDNGFEIARDSVNTDQATYELAEGTSPESRISPAAETPGWFYAQGNNHNGPVQLAELQRMVDLGILVPTTLVWRSGLANWSPAHQVPELRFTVSAAATPDWSAGPMPQQMLVAHPQSTRTSGLAIASLVLGILGLAGIGSLLATIFGAVALNQISRSNGTMTGKGMAIAGLVLGIVGLAGFVVLLWLGYLSMLLH
jgi:hypothetical protein